MGGRFTRRHTPGAEAPILWRAERPKAEALGYLDAEARTGNGKYNDRSRFFAALRMTRVLVVCRQEQATAGTGNGKCKSRSFALLRMTRV
jgi:hypothetical protein